MSKLSGIWANEAPSNPEILAHTTRPHKIHVLLVDHETESLVSTAKMLEMSPCKVTMVAQASTALEMLANGEEQFDAVLADIHSPDYQAVKLLERAVQMKKVIILMSAVKNAYLTRRALESGAFLLIKKPASGDFAEFLWQSVLREELNKNKAIHIVEDITDSNGKSSDPEGANPDRDNGREEDDDRNGKRKGKQKVGSENEAETNQSAEHSTARVKRKICTEWTKELHEKFMDAVNQLGEGSCYPKEIAETMNVPGLTRMQVASHLQKCRNHNWRAPDERKFYSAPPPKSSNAADGSEKKEKVRRFGTMPHSCINNNRQQQPEKQGNSQNPEINSGLGTDNAANKRGNSSGQVILLPKYLLLPAEFSIGQNASAQNGGLVQLGSFEMFNGASTNGAGNSNAFNSLGQNAQSLGNIGNRNSATIGLGVNLNLPYRPILPAFSSVTTVTNSGMNRNQPFVPNLPAFVTTVTTSRGNMPSQLRQVSDNFFEFPEMDYHPHNIPEFQQGLGTSQGQNEDIYTFDQEILEQFPVPTNKNPRDLQDGGSPTNFGSTPGDVNRG